MITDLGQIALEAIYGTDGSDVAIHRNPFANTVISKHSISIGTSGNSSDY